jgi:hypothetical protein
MELRNSVWNQFEQGILTAHAYSLPNAKVILFQSKKHPATPPWDLWARIFQWLGPSSTGGKWRVFWLPAEQPRKLPPAGEQVAPQHVNGGYCYPCKPDTIVIYRKEEATRVLLHELLHAACTDPHHEDLTIREATTETWAELYLVAVLSKGNFREAVRLWKIQSQWIADQNAQLQRTYDVYLPSDYAWRYTVGREYILEQLHIELPTSRIRKSLSARFTSPALIQN